MSTSPDGARYDAMRWNTPMSVAHAHRLLGLLELATAETLLDLGCGWGELLLSGLEHADCAGACAGVGVDTDAALLARGRRAATARGLDERVRFVAAPAQTWSEPADRVLCIGASHAWGGAEAALAALRGLLAAGGRLLFGDGCWVTAPTNTAQAIFGDGVPSLPELADAALRTGWRVLHLSTADQREWDEFESTWRRGREQWLTRHPEDPRGEAVREELDGRLREYVSAYRGVLGFAYLVLG